MLPPTSGGSSSRRSTHGRPAPAAWRHRPDRRPRPRRPAEGRRPHRGGHDRPGRPPDRRRRRGGRRQRQDRHPRLRRHPPAHLGGGHPRLRPQRHPRHLLRRGPRLLRPPVPARGRVRQQPGRGAGVRQRRHHDPGRLVAHQQHPRAPRRRHPRPPGGRHPGPVRLRQRQHLAERLLEQQQDRDPGRRRAAGPRHLLLLRRRPADHGPGHPGADLLQRRGGQGRVGPGPRGRHPDHHPRGHALGRPLRHGQAARRPGPARAGHHLHPLLLPERRGVAAAGRQRRHRSRSPPRSRPRWATAGRRC